MAKFKITKAGAVDLKLYLLIVTNDSPGIIATSHIWGYFADTKGRRLVLLVSLVLGFTTGLLSALAPNWIVLSGFKLVSASA